MKFFRISKSVAAIFSLDKRQRFAIQTIILTTGLLMTQLIWEDYRFLLVGLLATIAYILTAWSLKEDIHGVEWILLFILPVLFTVAVSLFYFLLPARWIIRLSTMIIFAIGTYATLLVENIYNVAALRSIQLLRAAQSVGILLSLVAEFLLTSILLSLRLSGLFNMLLIVPFTFLLTLQSLWSITLENKISRQVLKLSLVITLCIAELVGVLSFWPVQITTASLFIGACFYVLVGLTQQKLLEKLFQNTIREYIFAFCFTFILLILTTKWG